MTATPDNSSPRDLAAEFAALTGLDALDGADQAAMEHCGECPLGRAVRAMLGYDETVATMTAASHPPVPAPESAKAAILARISGEKAAEPPGGGYFFIGDQDGEWTPLPGGKVRLKVLSDLPGAPHTMVLLEADPGGVFFPHAHKGMEEVFLISGDLETEGRTLRAGDYLRAAPGTRHHKAVSHQGCRAILVTARDNHPRRAIGAYGRLVRSLRSLRRKPS
ncbi:cupin domain-containing protein [Luteolibacter marinus]|uniref:cupin domain-containing protein n=1 Tax=Luteolibacter marinus TaxID=2776705 RepID=UPI001868EADB|nr:cupin domain-containing protein [Luteolibacter marinus]